MLAEICKRALFRVRNTENKSTVHTLGQLLLPSNKQRAKLDAGDDFHSPLIEKNSEKFLDVPPFCIQYFRPKPEKEK